MTESWAAQACSLPAAERPTRMAEFDELFSSALLRLEQPEPGRVELTLDPTAEVAASAAALMVRETACCSFFTFTLTATGGQLQLDVTVPTTHIAVLDALETRAVAAISTRRRST